MTDKKEKKAPAPKPLPIERQIEGLHRAIEEYSYKRTTYINMSGPQKELVKAGYNEALGAVVARLKSVIAHYTGESKLPGEVTVEVIEELVKGAVAEAVENSAELNTVLDERQAVIMQYVDDKFKNAEPAKKESKGKKEKDDNIFKG